MSNLLLAQIRKERERRVEVKGRIFVVRRPTDLEISEFNGRLDQRKLLERFILGWEGFVETDFIQNGTDESVPFDLELYHEWIEDHPELWQPLTAAIVAEYHEHKARSEEAVKN